MKKKKLKGWGEETPQEKGVRNFTSYEADNEPPDGEKRWGKLPQITGTFMT